ncbi:hypothetical protein ACFL96_01845 [Thermoproteota archaeon]
MITKKIISQESQLRTFSLSSFPQAEANPFFVSSNECPYLIVRHFQAREAYTYGKYSETLDIINEIIPYFHPNSFRLTNLLSLHHVASSALYMDHEPLMHSASEPAILAYFESPENASSCDPNDAQSGS